MKIKLTLQSLIISSLLIGCGSSSDSGNGGGTGNGNGNGGGNGNGNGNGKNHNGEHKDKEFDLSKYKKTKTMTQELQNSLSYMGNEERLAYDIYTNLYNYHKDNNVNINQLKNISQNSEIKHIKIVQDVVARYNLVQTDFTNIDTPIDNVTPTTSLENRPKGRYGVSAIEGLYNTLYSLGINDKESALKVGCMVEVTDIEDLDKYITQAINSKAEDIQAAFEVLRKGSYTHYWSFDKGLKNIGITNGCYYKNDSLLTNKHNIYPSN